jgi:type VI secretion system secreted protein Hcp
MTRIQRLKKTLVAGAAAAALCGANVAAAAVDMFLKMDGIAGESTDEKHKGEIEILSFGWDIAPRSGDLVGRTAKVCAHDISFVKYVDKASPLLVSNAIVGTVIPKATLSVRKAGAGQQEFMVLELNSVLVSSVNHNVSNTSLQLEQFTLNFASATFTFKPQRADGSMDTPVVGMVSRTC